MLILVRGYIRLGFFPITALFKSYNALQLFPFPVQAFAILNKQSPFTTVYALLTGWLAGGASTATDVALAAAKPLKSTFTVLTPVRLIFFNT